MEMGRREKGEEEKEELEAEVPNITARSPAPMDKQMDAPMECGGGGDA